MTKEETIKIIESNPQLHLKQIFIYRRDKQYDMAVSYIQNEIGCSKEVAEQSVSHYFDRYTPKYTSTVITCPYCKSIDTKKISTAGRMISTGFFGLGSKKIGKQWHCNKCKSDF